MSNADVCESLLASSAAGNAQLPPCPGPQAAPSANSNVVFSLPDDDENDLLDEESGLDADRSAKVAETRNPNSSDLKPSDNHQQSKPPPAQQPLNSDTDTATTSSIDSLTAVPAPAAAAAAGKDKELVVDSEANPSCQTVESVESSQQLPVVAASDADAAAADSNHPPVAEQPVPACQPPLTKRQRQQQPSRQSSLATVANDASNSATGPISNALPPPPPPQLSAKQRAHQRAVKSASAFNRRFLASRPAGAVCTQTLQLLLPVRQPPTLHQQNPDRSAYPVAILPGQFAESCQHADTIAAGSERLNYLPLTSCLYSLPRRPPLPPVRLENSVKCTVCQNDCSASQALECSECHSRGHPACLQLPDNMLTAARAYAWQCMDCKRCQECLDPGNEERMMFCDACDRGFHTFCVGLQDIPQGHWECPVCVGPAAGGKPAASTAAAAADSVSRPSGGEKGTATATTTAKKPRGRKKKSVAAAAALELSATS